MNNAEKVEIQIIAPGVLVGGRARRDPLLNQQLGIERRLQRRLSGVSATACKHTPDRSSCGDDMWRFVLASAMLGVSSFGYAGQALAQSAPGALVIQDGMAA